MRGMTSQKRLPADEEKILKATTYGMRVSNMQSCKCQKCKRVAERRNTNIILSPPPDPLYAHVHASSAPTSSTSSFRNEGPARKHLYKNTHELSTPTSPMENL